MKHSSTNHASSNQGSGVHQLVKGNGVASTLKNSDLMETVEDWVKKAERLAQDHPIVAASAALGIH